MVSVNATAETFPYASRTNDIASPLERSRRLNTVLLVIIVMLLLFGALGGTYLYSVVTNLSSATGPVGPPGPNGLPGLDGAEGTDGYDGSRGLPGESGTDGRDGSSGVDGVDGVDGQAGANGIDGAPGADGVDGVTVYNSGQGVVDLGACDSNVHMEVRSRLVGDLFYLASITLSEISKECSGALVDLYALGGTSPDWETLTEATGVAISGDTLTISRDVFSSDSVLSSEIHRIALEVR